MRDQIATIIKEAVEELNEQLEPEQQLVFSEDLKLVGKKAVIDSMSFVTLVSIIEDLTFDKLGKSITIVSEKAFSQEKSPFYSIQTLADFIDDLLKDCE